jgi:3-dehydroquinate dehydratase-2
MRKIVVVNGPNLNLLGKREPHIYGTRSHADLVKTIRAKARDLGVTVSVFQSNHEGEIIDFLQKEAPGALGIVINPGALSHYSLALYDCLQALEVPTVEVHLSNIHAREEFRSKSVTARAALGVITGLGFEGYGLGMEYLAGMAKQ